MDWLFRVYTLESIPYITKMSEISENQTDEYEMEGMFAEVFFALQVFSFFMLTTYIHKNTNSKFSWNVLANQTGLTKK